MRRLILLGLVLVLAFITPAAAADCSADSDPFSMACHRELEVTRQPQVWVYRGNERGPYLDYRFVIDGKVRLGGSDPSCVQPLREDGLRVQVRWCAGEPLSVRYVSDHRQTIRFEWEIG